MSATAPVPGDAPDADFEARRARADHLKERIYLTFAALAVLLAINSHRHADPLDALLTLIVTVLGTLLAVFVADIISFVVAHERAMNAAERRHAVWASFGTLGAVTTPIILLTLSTFGILDIDTALIASIVVLVLTLILIGWVAVRKIPLTWWQRLIALGAEAGLALAVIGLQLLAHG